MKTHVENRKKVIIFGDLPLATKVVMHLQELNYIDIVGVVTNSEKAVAIDAFDCECLYNYAITNNIKTYTLEELVFNFNKKDFDFGLSVRFSKILNSQILALFQKGILNFHGGLLPEYGGLYSSCHEILQGSKLAGGTLHMINDEKIDTGDIVRRCEFEIMPTDTSESVFIKTQRALYDGFCNIINDFFYEKMKFIPQSNYINKGFISQYFHKNSLEKELQLDDATKKLISTHARGYEFSKHERGYIVYNGQKIYFTTKNLEGIL